MDLTDQTISGTNEICLNDSINTSLLKLKVKMTADTVIPSSNDLIIYVDKSTSSIPTDERKQYIFELSSPLKYFNQVGDELVEQISINNNEVSLEAVVKRYVGTNDSGNYVLDEILEEIVDSIPITLFEGINYIYTNYSDANITVIYPKDNELNRSFLNNVIYAEHIKNNSSEFNLNDLYFKDAFTQSGDKLNLEADNARVECITSKNNKFSLDSEGNLIVNSITTNEEQEETPVIDNATICSLIYPVGSIYMSVNSTSPATLFGGTWSRINGYYLYAGAGGKTAGSNTSGTPSTNKTGETSLTIEQIPSHIHNLWSQGDGTYTGAGWVAVGINGKDTNQQMVEAIRPTGGGQAHTHSLNSHTHSVAPLRYEVYMWKRTA